MEGTKLVGGAVKLNLCRLRLGHLAFQVGLDPRDFVLHAGALKGHRLDASGILLCVPARVRRQQQANNDDGHVYNESAVN